MIPMGLIKMSKSEELLSVPKYEFWDDVGQTSSSSAHRSRCRAPPTLTRTGNQRGRLDHAPEAHRMVCGLGLGGSGLRQGQEEGDGSPEAGPEEHNRSRQPLEGLPPQPIPVSELGGHGETVHPSNDRDTLSRCCRGNVTRYHALARGKFRFQ